MNMHAPRISLIAAIGKNRELGKDNKLLWHIPEDLKRFRDLTSGHPIIMGRKTFESIGRVLPNRTNIVITRNQAVAPRLDRGKSGIPTSLKLRGASRNQDNLVFVNSLEDAIKVAGESPGNDEIFIIGGGQIFEQAIARADSLYLTIVDKEYPDADVFLPEYAEFSRVVEEVQGEYLNLKYAYFTLQKS